MADWKFEKFLEMDLIELTENGKKVIKLITVHVMVTVQLIFGCGC